MAPVSAATRARTAQLTQKTNQFNLTTRRYTEQEIESMASSPEWSVWTLKVSDRFADNGLVGVAILRHRGESAEIDTLLMSCRVIGRTVETPFLANLLRQAEARGAVRVEGWFRPTKKNPPAADFYRQHGFALAEETPTGSRWSMELHKAASPVRSGSKWSTEARMPPDVLERVRSICAETFAVPVHRIGADSSPETVEAWDSVQHLNLVLAPGAGVRHYVRPGEMDRMKNVGSIAALIEKQGNVPS